MKIKRGDIYWIEQNKYRPAVGHMQNPGRPGIVVSNDANNAAAYTLEVVYLTTAPKKDLPTHCTITSAREPSTALCEQVTTISNEQLRQYIGTCTPEEMAQVDRCIAISLGLPDPSGNSERPATASPFFTEEEANEMAVIITRQEKLLAAANARAELLLEMYNSLLERAMA